MANPISSSDFSKTITDSTGVGKVMFNNTPELINPFIGFKLSQIITNDVVTKSSLVDQTLVSYAMLNEQQPKQTWGSIDVLIQADVGNTTDGKTPLYCVQRKITKLLIVFDNNTDWISNAPEQNPNTGVITIKTGPERNAYLTEYANICTTGPGTVSDYVGNYNIIKGYNAFMLTVTPQTNNYIQYKIISTCIASNEYLWIDPIAREYLDFNGTNTTIDTNNIVVTTDDDGGDGGPLNDWDYSGGRNVYLDGRLTDLFSNNGITPPPDPEIL